MARAISHTKEAIMTAGKHARFAVYLISLALLVLFIFQLQKGDPLCLLSLSAAAGIASLDALVVNWTERTSLRKLLNGRLPIYPYGKILNAISVLSLSGYFALVLLK